MERPPKFQSSGLKAHLKVINWFGVVAGVLMLVLPFMGAWWHATVGTEAMELAISPFSYDANLLGQSLTSPLVGYMLLAAKLMILIGGALMLAGSLMPTKWWGKCLMRFGAMKVLWMVIGLIVMLVLGAVFVNNFLPSMISGSMEGGTVQLSVPYITGTATSTIQMEGGTITAPITIGLTGVFWVAVLTAALGVAARIYHRRLVKPEKPKK